MATKRTILSAERLSTPFVTKSPFLFGVYHKDDYPAGNERMEAPRKGNGADFDPNAPYRMYHGDRIPGFPQHPHRGFETVTATMEGLIDHTDSLGSAGRYGGGDLQWMTAGSGVVHGENFPLINMDKENKTRFFQIWLNLPAKDKMVDPVQIMHWREHIPKVVGDGFVATVWAGELNGVKGLAPAPNSWAADTSHHVGIFYIEIEPGKSFVLPASSSGVWRGLYFCEGDSLDVDGATYRQQTQFEAQDIAEIKLFNSGKIQANLLVLQGLPIAERVVQRGPFVMNTEQEIFQAFMDYRKTQFGGWPWKEDAVIFPREKGRFQLVDGVEQLPPAQEGGHSLN